MDEEDTTRSTLDETLTRALFAVAGELQITMAAVPARASASEEVLLELLNAREPHPLRRSVRDDIQQALGDPAAHRRTTHAKFLRCLGHGESGRIRANRLLRLLELTLDHSDVAIDAAGCGAVAAAICTGGVGLRPPCYGYQQACEDEAERCGR